MTDRCTGVAVETAANPLSIRLPTRCPPNPLRRSWADTRSRRSSKGCGRKQARSPPSRAALRRSRHRQDAARKRARSYRTRRRRHRPLRQLRGGSGAPYRPWVEALGHLFAEAPDDLLAAIDPRRLADLTRVLPQVLNGFPTCRWRRSATPETERYLFYQGALAVFASLARRSRCWSCSNDLHWSDLPSLALLEHLVRNTPRRTASLHRHLPRDRLELAPFGEVFARLSVSTAC